MKKKMLSKTVCYDLFPAFFIPILISIGLFVWSFSQKYININTIIVMLVCIFLISEILFMYMIENEKNVEVDFEGTIWYKIASIALTNIVLWLTIGFLKFIVYTVKELSKIVNPLLLLIWIGVGILAVIIICVYIGLNEEFAKQVVKYNKKKKVKK